MQRNLIYNSELEELTEISSLQDLRDDGKVGFDDKHESQLP